jgi:hypothetical protein
MPCFHSGGLWPPKLLHRSAAPATPCLSHPRCFTAAVWFIQNAPASRNLPQCRQLEHNRLGGKFPQAWSLLGPQLSWATLYSNPLLTGFIPRTWKNKVMDSGGSSGSSAWAGTRLQGVC